MELVVGEAKIKKIESTAILTLTLVGVDGAYEMIDETPTVVLNPAIMRESPLSIKIS